jgi:hypothetical protein
MAPPPIARQMMEEQRMAGVPSFVGLAADVLSLHHAAIRNRGWRSRPLKDSEFDFQPIQPRGLHLSPASPPFVHLSRRLKKLESGLPSSQLFQGAARRESAPKPASKRRPPK